ncbi:MAG: HAD family hydrolase [Candidatus Magasanikbacteria bacterium]|jgi:hypothetical protein
MFLVDFDDTLFDSQALKRALLKAASECGVSEEVFWQSYKQAYHLPDGRFAYHTDRHAEVLGEMGFDKNKIKEKLQNIISKLDQFRFSGTISFLNKIKSSNEQVVLLSLGDPSFQQIKVEGAGIMDFFDQVFMVDKSKAEIIEQLLAMTKDKNVWLINDKPQESIDLHKQFPILKIVLKKSSRFGQDEYIKSGFNFFNDLLGIYKYVEEHK